MNASFFHRAGVLFCLVSGFLLSGCLFSSRELSISEVPEKKQFSYFKNNLLDPDTGLHFDSGNYLNGTLQEKLFSERPDEVLARLDEAYRITKGLKYLFIAVDLCENLAERADGEAAVRYHLSAIYYCEKATLPFRTADWKGSWTPSVHHAFYYLRLLQLYNQALCGIFYDLKEHKKIFHDSFTLKDSLGHNFVFRKPHFRFSVPTSQIREITPCSHYSVKGLHLKSRFIGMGVPLTVFLQEHDLCKSLRTPRGLTLPATVWLKFEKKTNPDEIPVRMIYEDTTLYETTLPKKDGSVFPIQLAADFSTPLACFINALPEKNLLGVMLNPEREEKDGGLYLLEPYNPGKIPLVFVHGLMSSPNTWLPMINALRNDPEIRQRYQFWFYNYSSGTPILFSASKLRDSLLKAREEFCRDKVSAENFKRMVLAGHSMGGLIVRVLLQKNPHFFVEESLHCSWERFCSENPPEIRKKVEKFAVFPELPFVRRAVFLAVPHRGASMAKRPIASLGSHLIRMPETLLKASPSILKTILKYNQEDSLKDLKNVIYTGIDNLDPDNNFIQIIQRSEMQKNLVLHSIIGNREARGVPGGTDGIVPYASSHLDGIASERIVKSGHSVHRSPEAIREVQKILRLHLKETSSGKRP